MQCKDFKGEKLSRLGMGNMRLPTVGEGRGAPIDFDRGAEIIDYAMSHGVNYYDTAYVYTGSEEFLGKAMAKYDRASYNLATKYNSMAGPDYKAVFAQQLERLKTDYIDFYLLHAVMNEESMSSYIDSGAVDYFLEQKKQGRIRYLGFSSHAPLPVLEKMADHHQWDFAQIQLNYLDWTLQNAEGQYNALTSRGIPVVVMEPVRGGRLASLSPAADKLLKEAHPDWSVASWAFRWLRRLDNVQVILSGMSNLEQIADNVGTFDNIQPLSDGDTELLKKACDVFKDEISVPCTACRYCCDECPAGIEIPKVMEAYNASRMDSGPMGLMGAMGIEPGAKDCLACGACKKHCPQGIDIPAVMEELRTAIEHMPPRP